MKRIGIVLLLLAGVTAAARGQVASPHVSLGNRQCSDCHNGSDNWKAITFAHDRTGFALRGQHRVAPCEGCHDVRNFAAVQGTCRTCHEDPHRGDAGPRCETCHNQSAWRDIDAPQAHARTRLPDLGVHAALRCEDCHRNTGNRPFTSPVTPCAGCHLPTYQATTNPAHQAIGFSTTCNQCHQLATWSFALFAQHDAIFPIYTESHAHTWQSCASCHPVANDFKQFTCTSCHTQSSTDPRHQGIPDYQWNSAACRSCHPNGKGGLVDHEVIFPINSGAHAGTWQGQCTVCHTDPNSRLVFTCMGGACHVQTTTDGLHQGITGYGYTATQCLTCHPDGRAGTFTAHDQIFPIYSGTHRSRWSSCTSCHTTPGDRSQFICLASGCHSLASMNSHHSGVQNYQSTPAACLACHTNGRAP